MATNVIEPYTIREPIELEYNTLRDAIEKAYVVAKRDLEIQYHEDLAANAAAKSAALVAAGLNPDGSVSPEYYPRELDSDINLFPPVNSVVPTITGTAQVGEILTAHEGTWTGSPTFAYQWVRADADGSNAANISGETDATYTLAVADDGKKVRVVVTGTNDDGDDVGVSAYTGVVIPA